ncbi:prepilin-type N-terminal cleavage/methylation domain-containing protein [bacterium]
MKSKITKKGFTYIEVILAMTILSYLILAFSNVFVNGIIVSKNMQYKTIASNLAQDDLEKIRSYSYVNVSSTTYENTIQNKLFSVSRGVTEITADELKQVSVSVEWQEGANTKDVSAATLISKYQ